MLVLQLLALAATLLPSTSAQVGVKKPQCRCSPAPGGCWPDTTKWNKLNDQVGGRLIRTVPLGHVCHDPDYDAEACKALQTNWRLADTHDEDPASIMQTWWAKGSCDPFGPRTDNCTIGSYAQYSIEVESVEDMQAGIAFAQSNNVRLVVKNTGHDQTGRSTGYGSLSLWTHKLKGPEFIPDHYGQGPAVKVMAGDQVDEVLAYLQPKGYVAVGGTCPSVGIAGGYTPGGGHSTLSTFFGLAADQTLEFELITADGKLVKASPTENHDLYWAMSGGGPFTYAIVWSMTIKVHKDFPVGAASVIMEQGTHPDSDLLQVAEAWHSTIPAIIDAGAYAYAYYYKTHFQIRPALGHNLTKEATLALIQPIIKKMDDLGFTYNLTTADYPTYFDAYTKAFGPWRVGAVNLGGRLLPKDFVYNDQPGLAAAVRPTFDAGGFLIETAMAPSLKAAGNPDNAVLPAWRDTVLDLVVANLWNDTASLDVNAKSQAQITNVYLPPVQKATPNAGVYMNEGDPNDVDWKVNFFGANYDRLLEIKKKWDPESLFYAYKTVGSDAWVQNEDGTLCRAPQTPAAS